MSFNRDKPKNQRNALKAFAASENTSGSSTDDDDGLDIVKTSKKKMDLAQYIGGQ